VKRAAILAAALALAACGVRPEDAGDLQGRLCDPASMQIRNVQRGPDATTGQINARNVAGGYAGFVPFMVDRKTGHGRLGVARWGGLCDLPDPQKELDAHLALLEQYERNTP